MCTVSDKLKLCTCTNLSQVSAPRSYWVLYREDKGKPDIVLGMPVMPTQVPAQIFLNNKVLLLKRLNEPGIFDFKTEFRDNDRLFLHFDCGNAQWVDYTFTYAGDSWEEIFTDPFDLENHYKIVAEGPVEKALADKPIV